MSGRYIIPPLGVVALIPLSLALFPEKEPPVFQPIGAVEAAQTSGRVLSLPRGGEVDQSLITKISTRPLFSADRRATPVPQQLENTAEKPAETVEEDPVVIVPPKLSLIGMVQNENGEARALVALPGDRQRWIGVGEKIEDWTVASISEDGVTIEHSGESAAFSFAVE